LESNPLRRVGNVICKDSGVASYKHRNFGDAIYENRLCLCFQSFRQFLCFAASGQLLWLINRASELVVSPVL
jgi:hypothetical protein